MSARDEDKSLSEDERKLVELQHEETIIETEEHHGFGDAARMTRLDSEIEELETDVFHEKVRIKDEHH